MDKKITAISESEIEITFGPEVKRSDVLKLMESCSDGSCGCSLDMKKDFESFELHSEKPLLRFTVVPEKQSHILKEMENCNCSLTPEGKTVCC